MRRATTLLALTLTTLAAAAPTVRAEDRCPPRPADRELAERLSRMYFTRAMSLYENLEHHAALLAFQCANELVPHRLTRYWIAVSAEASGRYAHALTIYHRLLPDPPPPVTTQELLERIAWLGQRADIIEAQMMVLPRSKRVQERIRAHQAWITALELGLGTTIYRRRLAFQIDGGLYDTDSPVATLRVETTCWPAAFATKKGLWPHLGFGLVVDRAFHLVSYPENSTVAVATTAMRVGGYLAWRWNVYRSPRSPELRFLLGIEGQEFSFAKDLGLIPGVSYIFVRPAVRARFHLGTERVAIRLGFAGLIGVQTGQIGDAYHYGDARSGGVHAIGEIDVRLFWKIHLVAGITTTWVFLRFPQRGLIHRDYEYVAESAKDGYYGGYFMMGARY